ncbi:unnamed protein product [Cuscuta epithymum]|uniref:Transposase MuDR plant domain-containing protein n=1 Tax=Cuscuta epithymum TaxID=186058 RepID=A0AAV0DB00_9ASTE|nr:unnamed protein product [Cuscuta epithymum]
MNGGKYMLMPLIDELAITNMWGITQMEDMSTIEIYIEKSCDAYGTQSTSNVVVSTHDVNARVNAGNSSKAPVLDMVIQEDGRYLHNGASFVDGQGSDDDADENINGDDMTESDEDDGDTVTETAPSSNFTRMYELREGFTDAWMSGSGEKRFTPNGEFEVGQQFDNKEQVINMMSLYSIKRNQFYRVIESDKHKWVAQCKRKKESDCPWRIRATKNKGNLDTFTIVRYPGPHSSTCVGNTDTTDHVALTSDFISKDIVELHLPDRVLRQFGFEHVVPRPIDTYVELHRLDRRGKHTEDWALRHV